MADKGNDEYPAEDVSHMKTSKWTYHLVVIMLGILAGLAVLIILLPVIASLIFKDIATFKDPATGKLGPEMLTEYSKWMLSVLLGAFGAWIGAGAAYFFGKENLKESSRSTENALKIQQEGFQRPGVLARIKDMALTAMNPNFVFSLEGPTEAAIGKLKKVFRGYWFVPVVEKDTGILKDVIHAQVFWDPKTSGKAFKDLIADMDKDPDLKMMHGDSFYGTVTPDEKISDVRKRLDDNKQEVAIVVDDKGKPSHCLTRTQLRTLLKIAD
jgi:uncharacterized membrane protein YsdA (DUF1294 family)